ncbi:MAG: hypothetical protein ACI8UP_005044 [Porticoccaceae bacterium]|jgi:hypothetical protein
MAWRRIYTLGGLPCCILNTLTLLLAIRGVLLQKLAVKNVNAPEDTRGMSKSSTSCFRLWILGARLQRWCPGHDITLFGIMVFSPPVRSLEST